MAEITKQALKVDNNQSFPNNNNGAITPSILRAFNENMIDSMVDEISYNVDSASWNSSISQLNAFSASAQSLTTGSLLITASAVSNVITFTKGNGSTFNVTVADTTDLGPLNQFTASAQISLNNLNLWTSSYQPVIVNLQASQSIDNTKFNNIGGQSGSWDNTSLNSYTASNDTKWNTLGALSGSFVTESETGSFARTDVSNTFTQANTFTSISASSFVSASTFVGDGSKLTNITSSIALPILDEGIPQGNAVSMNFTGSAISAIVVGGTAIVSVNAISTASLNELTASFNTYTQSNDTKWNTLGGQTGSFVTESETGSFARVDVTNTFTQPQIISAAVTASAAKISNLNYPTADNGALSFVQTDGAGNLSLQYVQQVFETIRNMSGVTLAKGTPVYISGSTGDNGNAYIADASDLLKMPAVYIAGEDLNAGDTGLALLSGKIEGVDTSAFTPGTIIYVAEGGGYTDVRPSGSASVVQVLGVVSKQGVGGQGVIINQLEAVLPNIQTGYAWVGNGLNQPVQVATSSFGGTTDITALNVFTASQETKNTTLENVTSSLQSYTASQNTINTNVGLSASLYEAKFDTIGTQSGSWGGGGSDLTSLNSFTASQETKNTTLENVTASLQSFTASQATLNATFATTGSNSFDGNQIISGGLTLSGSFGITYVEGGAEVIQQVTALGNYQTLYDGGLLFQTDGVNNYEQTIPTTMSKGLTVNSGSFLNNGVTITGGFTASLQQGYAWVGNVGGTTIEVPTSSFAGGSGTTFENPSVESISGSLLLTANTFTSGAASINHISSSTGGKVNLIFKNSNTTADTIISGSNNIFSNPVAPSTGFKRYLGNNNIAIGVGFPQISGSMQFSPTINTNYLGANINIRGAVSASAMNVNTNVLLGAINVGSLGNAVLNAEKLTGTTNIANNFVAGNVQIIANQSEIRNLTNITQNNINGLVTLNLSSSATIFAQNTINDGAFVFTNQFSSGSLGFGQATVLATTIGGTSNTLIATGSQTVLSTAQAGFQNNLILGTSNTAFVNSSESRISGTNVYHQLQATSLLGNRLIVTGSSNANDTTSFGSVFVGRFNANDGIRDKSSDIVFAVGTGTSVSNRKTGFLIDSGSNTFVEGTLNVSGATSLNGDLIITGSLTASLQQGYVWVGDASGKTTTVATSSFGGGGAAFPYTGNAVITGSLGISGSMFGGVIDLVVASATASVDFSAANMFTLTLPSASTHILPTNVRAGQTVNIQITQPTPGTGSVTFPSAVKFAGGNDYQATTTGSAIDMLTLVSYDGSNVLGTSIKNFL